MVGVLESGMGLEEGNGRREVSMELSSCFELEVDLESNEVSSGTGGGLTPPPAASAIRIHRADRVEARAKISTPRFNLDSLSSS
jgi:hypothetical protein